LKELEIISTILVFDLTDKDWARGCVCPCNQEATNLALRLLRDTVGKQGAQENHWARGKSTRKKFGLTGLTPGQVRRQHLGRAHNHKSLTPLVKKSNSEEARWECRQQHFWVPQHLGKKHMGGAAQGVKKEKKGQRTCQQLGKKSGFSGFIPAELGVPPSEKSGSKKGGISTIAVVLWVKNGHSLPRHLRT